MGQGINIRKNYSPAVVMRYWLSSHTIRMGAVTHGQLLSRAILLADAYNCMQIPPVCGVWEVFGKPISNMYRGKNTQYIMSDNPPPARALALLHFKARGRQVLILGPWTEIWVPGLCHWLPVWPWACCLISLFFCFSTEMALVRMS